MIDLEHADYLVEHESACADRRERWRTAVVAWMSSIEQTLGPFSSPGASPMRRWRTFWYDCCGFHLPCVALIHDPGVGPTLRTLVETCEFVMEVASCQSIVDAHPSGPTVAECVLAGSDQHPRPFPAGALEAIRQAELEQGRSGLRVAISGGLTSYYDWVHDLDVIADDTDAGDMGGG